MLESASSTLLRDAAELRRYFVADAQAKACRERECVGVEHERIGVIEGGRAPGYASTIRPLLARLQAAGWSAVEEDGALIGLDRGQARVSLEPGGQVEFSDRPRADGRDLARALDDHDRALAAPARELGITWLGIGFRPLGSLDDVPWMPKGRYAIMRAYLPGRGRLAHEMMKRTATVQANLDYRDQADAAEKMRLALGITSLVTALWANSPLRDGRVTGYQSYRAACWLETDEDRCGLLPFAFAAHAPERLFADYAEWALDVPMIFLVRGGRYLPVENVTFRRFVAEGMGGERATLADWETHLSTLFPEVRLKRYLEVRGADAGSWGMVKALPAFYRGLLYDREARLSAWELVSSWSYAERLELRRRVPREGLAARVVGQPIGERARELVAIAREGLRRLGDEPALLDPVVEIARSGRTDADRTIELCQRAGGDARALIDGLRLDRAAPPA